MKHAFLITAYNEPEILKHELKMLDHAKVDMNILMLSVKNMQECNLLAFGIKILKIILTE